MLIEFSGICQNCRKNVKILTINESCLENCSDCGQPPFIIKKIKGIIYIAKNENQKGVKIGITEKSIDARIKQLESTGVPGKFIKIAIFPSDKPKIDEKKVHTALKKYNLSKEHFELEPIEAVLKTFRALKKKVEPIFFDKNNEAIFNLKNEEARIQTLLRFHGKTS
jgi:hypothetical protein